MLISGVNPSVEHDPDCDPTGFCDSEPEWENIGAWNRMMTSYKKRSPVMIPLAQNPPTKFKKIFLKSKLHGATSHYRVSTAL